MSGDKRAAAAAEDADKSPKRQRTEAEEVAATAEEAARVHKVLEQVAAVEDELDKDNAKQAKEILAVETRYNKAKRPAYEKRNKLLGDISSFWKQALVNHPLVGNFIDENDQKIIDYVTALDVHFIDDLGSFKIELTLSENPFLSNKMLWKLVTYKEDTVEGEEEEPEVTAVALEWKETDEAKEVMESTTFIEWFATTEGTQDVAEIIKDDLYKTPVQYYLQDEEDEDEDDEEEEDESAEDESAEDEEE